MSHYHDLKSNPLPRQVQRWREICVASGDALTLACEVYPRMFPFFKDDVVVFCNEVCNPLHMAKGLQGMLDNNGLLPEKKAEMIQHILSEIAHPPVDETKEPEEAANKTQEPEKEEMTDNVYA